MPSWLVVPACVALAIYIALCAVLYFFQARMIFPASPLPADFSFRAMDGVEEVKIPIDVGDLSGLHFKNPSPKGLIFFLHGNAGNLDTWVPDVDYYRREDFDLFMLDYRGYGKSDGKVISQQQIVDDVKKAWQLVGPVYQERNIPVMIYGRSIGTYFATKLASEVSHDALVLVSPFSSMRALVAEKFPLMPRFLLRFKLRTDLIFPKVGSPIYLIHGDKDVLIPFAHAQTLASLSNDIKLTKVAGAGHSDIHDFERYKSTMSSIARSIANDVVDFAD